MTNETPYATRLQEILEVEGRKQSWLSDLTGISPPRLSQFVNGILHPGEENRKKIAEALGRSDEADALFLPATSDER